MHCHRFLTAQLRHRIRHHHTRLTQFSHGGGCGCKLGPKVLESILSQCEPLEEFPRLIVGNQTKDDAAVYDIGDGRAVVSTTDFFAPIVDNALEFGKIAACNAISDIYAMGAQPLMAIAILGWPIRKLSNLDAVQVIRGAQTICKEAKIPLSGGHSIDCLEPIFGLAVTGILDKKNLKRNDTCTPGCLLYLTKPLGIGIMTTAERNGKLQPSDKNIATYLMCRLNDVGLALGSVIGVKAMTDVTGFGLLGHLIEMCDGSNVAARIYFQKIPILCSVSHYIDQNCIPGGTIRNYESYSQKCLFTQQENREFQKAILCDPQTSGGLLIAVEPGLAAKKVESILNEHNIPYQFPIGEIIKRESTWSVELLP